MNEFHDTVMFKKETAEDQARFFLHPELTFVSYGEDLSLQTNYEIHQKLTDERLLTTSDNDSYGRLGPVSATTPACH